MTQNGTEKGLTARQLRAIEALATGATKTEAAKQAGCGRSTLAHWLADPAFVARLRTVEGEALAVLSRRVAALGDAAADAIAAGLAKDQPITVRLRAATLVIGNAPALAEITNILERLDRLEAGHNDHDTKAA